MALFRLKLKPHLSSTLSSSLYSRLVPKALLCSSMPPPFDVFEESELIVDEEPTTATTSVVSKKNTLSAEDADFVDNFHRLIKEYGDNNHPNSSISFTIGFTIPSLISSFSTLSSRPLSPSLLHDLFLRCSRDRYGGSFPQALSLFNWWLSSTSNTIPVSSLTDPFNDIIEFAAKLRHFDLAWSLLDEMRARTVPITFDTFARIIRCYARAHLPSEAARAFCRMNDYGCPADLRAFSSTILILSKNTSAVEALSFFDLYKARFPPSVAAYTTLIHACLCANRIDETERLMKEMKQSGVKPNVCTYTAMISGLFRAGKNVLAENVFAEMTVLGGVQPNAATFNSMMRGYIRMGRSERVLMLFRKMLKMGCEPDVLSFNCLIFAHCQHKNLNTAIKVIDWMVKKGHMPNSFSFNPVFNLILKIGSSNCAIVLYSKMRGLKCKPDIVTYNLLMQNFSNDHETMLGLMKAMEEDGVKPNVNTYNVSISLLCKMELFDQAYQLMCEMMENKNMKPPESMIKLLLKGLRKAGKKAKVRDLVDKLRERGLTGLNLRRRMERPRPVNWVDEL